MANGGGIYVNTGPSGLVSFLDSLQKRGEDEQSAKALQNYASQTMYGQAAPQQQPGVLSQLLGGVTRPISQAIQDSGLGAVPGVGPRLADILNFGGGNAQQQGQTQSGSLGSLPLIGGALDGLFNPGRSQQPDARQFPSSSSPQSGSIYQAQPQPGDPGAPAMPQPRQNAAASQPGTLSPNMAGMLANRERNYGLPQGYLATTALIESGGDPNAVSPTGAKGIFGFTGGTAKQYGLTDPTNPMQSADAAGRLGADNMKALKQALGRDPTAGELYLAHQQGAAGAAALIKNPNVPAGQVLASIGADPNNIAVNGGDPNAPAGAFVGRWASRFDNGGNAQPQQPYAIARSSTGQPVPTDAQGRALDANGQPTSAMAFAGGQPQPAGQNAINGATSGQPQPYTANGTASQIFSPSAGASNPGNATALRSKLPPQEALNMLLASEGTRQFGIDIIKAFQAKQLGPTYTVTQVPGLGWVNVNHDTGQASLLKGDDVMSPEALAQKKELVKAGKEKDDSYSVQPIGEDPYGNKVYGTINKSTGVATPITLPGNSQNQPQQNVSDLHGAEFLATLDPQIAGQVKAIVEGRAPYPTGMFLKTPFGQKLATLVTQADPSFETGNATTRTKLRNEFSTGGPSSPAYAITAGNTAIGHLGELSDAAEGLNNSSIPMVNSVYNNTAQAFGGGTNVTKFNNILGRFAEEATKFYRGTGGTEADVQRDIANLNAAQSPAQLRTAIAAQAKLMQSKIDALQDRWRTGMGPLVPDFPIVTGHSKQAMDRIKGRGANAGSGHPSLSDAEAEMRRRGLIR